ncbi:MAG TPA: DUF4062 domain-containing protein [Terriglobales bacterium]|jgi:tetratricopeptide (TPR) repeat protein
MVMQVIWHARPVFVSSTFRDMQAERDHLARFVFPELEERLRERFHHLEPIDLRWGVETVTAADQESKELLVLTVCLGEIERSRPFLIALLGDRYGWVPPESRMRDAATEVKYEGDLAGKSVTALEIAFGVLASEDQRRRSWFYFREKLPYAEMDLRTAAELNDAYSPEADVRARHDKLLALKEEVTSTMRRWGMPERVRPYTAKWDAEHKCVTGLEAWGTQVLEDLWSDLDKETRAYLGAAPVGWQEIERRALGEFVELACRDFMAREAVLSSLKERALSPASPTALWGKCVTGAPGAGKSALLARLVHDLEPDALVLMHAAGISPRSTQVEDLLRRFIFELASSLGITDPAEALTAHDDLERMFAQLLARAAGARRVVVLIDALNQFERTPSAMYLTWLPKLWPENARLIATTIPGVESKALAGRVGVEELMLPALSAPEAETIAFSLGQRYHKTIHPEVTAALLSKCTADGTLAAGNPLWLTLAIEELLLLDADDFARASRTYAGNEEDKLHALLVDTARQLPPTVEALYSHLLARNEKVHGVAWASAFAKLIAATRSGLRESDLTMLLPRETLDPWEPLRLAALRRGFRAHLSRRGALVEWDFFHLQMREAVRKKYFGDIAEERRMHSVLADHFEALPREDPLRQREIMFHLLRSDQPLRAAKYYAGGLSEGELAGSTDALASFILDRSNETATPALAFVASWLGPVELPRALRLGLCQKLLASLQPALVGRGLSISILVALIQAVQKALPDLGRLGPLALEPVLFVVQGSLGDSCLAQGHTNEALYAYRAALGIAESMARRNPMSHGVQRQLAVSYERLGEAHDARCEYKKALRAHRTALQLFDGLLSHDPENPNRIHERGGCLSRIGSLQLAQGRASEAQSAYEECLRLARKLVAQDSTSADWQRNLLVSYGHLADVRKLLGDAAGALELHRRALEIAVYLADRDPSSVENAATLAICHANVGRALAAGERHEEALASYACALRIIEPIVERNPIDAALQTDWVRLLAEIAAIERRAGNESSAQSHFERSRLALARMREAGMALVGPQPEGLHEDTPGVAPAQPKTWWQFWR